MVDVHFSNDMSFLNIFFETLIVLDGYTGSTLFSPQFCAYLFQDPSIFGTDAECAMTPTASLGM